MAGAGRVLCEVRADVAPGEDEDRLLQGQREAGDYPHRKFDFLGYTFRPRLAKDRYGRCFVSFTPAASDNALKATEESGPGAHGVGDRSTAGLWRGAHDLDLSAEHIQSKRKNNRAEGPHVPIRLRERKMLGFRSPGSTRRFLASHSPSPTLSPPAVTWSLPPPIASFDPRLSARGARLQSLRHSRTHPERQRQREPSI